MIYTIHIPDRTERLRFAEEIQKILVTYTEYIPGHDIGLYQSDIGIKADVDEKELKKIESLIERRGYPVSKKKEGPDDSGPSASVRDLPQ